MHVNGFLAERFDRVNVVAARLSRSIMAKRKINSEPKSKDARERQESPETQNVPKRRVFIVDDHPIVRQGLAQLINGEPDLAVCGQGEEAYQALRAIKEARPDIVLLDISLKDSDGIELAKELKAQMPHLAVLMLSMHDETMYTERALRAGARGYVMKQEPPNTLLAAVRKVLSGQVHVSDKMGASLLQRMVSGKKSKGGLPMDRLTDRELEVFRMIGAGKSVKEIAGNLFLSTKTVEAHR